MSDYRETAEAFQRMAHEIVWCSVATVEPDGRPRTRVLHPYWEWEDNRLVGWIASSRTGCGSSPARCSLPDAVNCSPGRPDLIAVER